MRSSFSRVAGVIALLMLVVASWPIAANHAGLAQGNNDLTAAAQAAVAADFGVPADQIVIAIVAQDGDWAYGTGVNPGGGEDGNPETRFFLAHHEPDGWHVALRYTSDFDLLLRSAPSNFPTPEIRTTLEGFSAAGDGSSQLSFPFPENQTWGFLGPHPAQGATTRDALDFYPYYGNATNAPVLAMRGGVVYRPCENMILIDHGDGWTTGYYHVINPSVQNGQMVQRGQQIGGTSDQFNCGGFANGPHVHIWVEFRGQSVDIAGRDIGGWTVEAGPNPYDGCLVKGNTHRCTVDGTNYIVNDGEIGSGSNGAVASLGLLYGKVGDAIPYDLSGFPVNSSVAITWKRPGGSTVALTPATTDGSGSATGSLIVPETNAGPGNSVIFTSGSIVRTTTFDVDPALTVTPAIAAPGESITASIHGFPKKAAVQITFIDGQTYTRVLLGTLTASNIGSGSGAFPIPAGTTLGLGSVEASDGTDYAFADLRLVNGPTLWLDHTTVRAADEIEFGIARFPADSPVTITMTPAGGGAALPLATTTTDASGGAESTLTLPEVPFGAWTALAESGGTTAQFAFTIIPRIEPVTDPAARGATVDIAAFGFTPNSTITISWDRGTEIIPLGSGTSNAQGSATVPITIPGFPDGTFLSIHARDGATGEAYASLEVQGGPPVGTPDAQLTTTRTTVNVSVGYTLTGFPPASDVQITWIRASLGTIALGTVTTDLMGNASGAFPVPAATGGLQGVRFSTTGATVDVPFEIVPRIKVTPATVARGANVDVSLRGYGKKEVVRIRWKQGSNWVTVATVTTSNTGSANVTVAVPAWVPDGTTSVRGDGTVFRAQTNAITVSGGTFVPANAGTPTATPSPSPTPTTTPIASPSVTVVPSPTEIPTERPTETPTTEPTVEPTQEPTETPTELPSETPTPPEASEGTAVP